MGLITILFQDPGAFFILLITLLYSIIFHEVAHGFVARLFGDRTAQYAGRLTLNPKDHIDPAGAIMLLIVGFGWAKPVPVNYSNLRPFRAGLISVACAGCVTNILMATCAYFLIQLPAVYANRSLSVILHTFAEINIILGAFNLIPIPPLDGSKIVMGFLPERFQYRLASLESYGYIILIVLIVTHALDPVLVFFKHAINIFIAGILTLLFR